MAIDATDRGGELEALRSSVEALRSAEDELARQNEELASLRFALAKEAERYRSLFDSAPVAYVTTDEQGLIREANAAASELLGLRPPFLVGKPLPLYVVEADRRLVRRQIHELATVGTAAILHVRMRRRNDVPLDAVLRARATTTEICWVIHDVTEEHQAEQRLWELNADLERRVVEHAGELATVVEQLPVGVTILDGDLRLLRINQRARELFDPFGFREGDIAHAAVSVTRADGSPIPPDDRPLARARRGEIVTSEVVYYADEDGTRHAFSTSAAPVRDGEGNVTRVVAAFDEVTAQLRRDQADRDFVANAAHQIRTPITAIATAVAALQAGAKEVPHDRDRFLHHVEAEVDRLARLGEALLTLTRAQRTKDPPDLTIVPIRELLDTLVAELTALPVPIEVDCGKDVAALSNRALLEQGLANLLENAVKHAAGAPVSVVARRVDEHVVVDVVDRGHGMTTDDLEHAFDRFYRGPEALSGFGLGLPIAYETIRAVGGTLELESTPATGTRARVTVPGGRLLR